jgi:hypothetical protein
MKLFLIIAFALIPPISLLAQVESPVSIKFIDPLDSNNRVTGIRSVTNATNGLNVATFVSGYLNYCVASGTNSLNVTLPFSPVLTEGFLIHIKAGSYNTGPVTLSVNGSVFYPVKKHVSIDVDSAEIRTGQIVSVVFDGSVFQVISMLSRPCKNGFVSVNNEYCIDKLPRPISNFYNAVLSCGANDAMLCTWNQWYLACNDSLANGSSGYMTNFEWVNDAGNNGTDAKVAGFNNASAYAGYGCKKSYSLLPTKTFHNSAIETSGININILFRCCYKK